ncbi:MAG: hydratase [Oscillospiraceae bacterium]|nr:hydratase [Oscillospiraceae bacterium]
MIKLTDKPVMWQKGAPTEPSPAGDKGKTMSAGVLAAHGGRQVRFDGLISHDITYVGVIQTALASGLERFHIPYVLTNCHNSLCAVGGTINADDHVFGLSAAKKFGGEYVPANMAVIHQYAREALARCGGMILGSDSHTRYGALGTMGIGEGGPELVKQLLGDTYEVPEHKVILVYVTGKPRQGVGPHDAALALCGAVFPNGFVKNAVLEFAGPGIGGLSMDWRMGVDVMTTETACLSSLWQTDEKTQAWLTLRGRGEAYRPMAPADGALYDGMVELDLSAVVPMAAMPFHPSKAVPVSEIAGRRAGQGIIAGCAGGLLENIAEAAAILKGRQTGNGYFDLSVYPASVPVNMAAIQNGSVQALLEAGAVLKPCFCGPCFGAGDVPANDSVSLRHTTRNFPNREGSQPGQGQRAEVILMDARSIAATAANGGIITPATEIDYEPPVVEDCYDPAPYASRVYHGFGNPQPGEELRYGPGIRPWPEIPPMPEGLEVTFTAVIQDPVTTTDELIPSGETSGYRSDPIKLASFALSRRVPEYVSRCQTLQAQGKASAIYAVKPGDGSAREQAASCQRVLGGAVNVAKEYATKRYRSNLINWGILPFLYDGPFEAEPGEVLTVPGIREAVASGAEQVTGLFRGREITLGLGTLSPKEREILLAGCLMNWYRLRKEGQNG